MLKQCATVICIASLAACVSNQAPPAAAIAAAPAPAPRPTQASGIDLQYVDVSVRPQDDVYQYLNGKWLRDYQMPADKGAVGSFTVLQDKTEEQLRTIVDALDRTAGGQDPDAQKLADLYASYMDEERAQALGPEAVAPGICGDRCDQEYGCTSRADGAPDRDRSGRALQSSGQSGCPGFHAVRGHPASKRLGNAGSGLLPEG